MLQRFKLKLFEEPNRDIYPVRVPRHSVLRCVKVITDGEMGPGLYVIYECPALETGDFLDKFVILQGKQEVPPNAEYVDILDVIFEDKSPEGETLQGTVLIPIYRITSAAKLGGIDADNEIEKEAIDKPVSLLITLDKSKN